MKKVKVQENLDAIKKSKEYEEIKKQEKEVARKIEDVLTSDGFALQPFIHTAIGNGVISALEARVRLVKVEKHEEKPN